LSKSKPEIFNSRLSPGRKRYDKEAFKMVDLIEGKPEDLVWLKETFELKLSLFTGFRLIPILDTLTELLNFVLVNPSCLLL